MHRIGGILASLAFCALMFAISLTATATDVTVSLTLWGQTGSIQLPATAAQLEYVGSTSPVGIWEGKISPVTVSADYPFTINAADSTSNNDGFMHTSDAVHLYFPLLMRLYGVNMPTDYYSIPSGDSLTLFSGDPFTTYDGELDFRQQVDSSDTAGSYSTKIGIAISPQLGA